MPSDRPIELGHGVEGAVTLRPKTFLRHVACLGSSGSGKTVACKVICEEFVRRGIPIIAVDPQGDIASLLFRAKPKSLEDKDIPNEVLEEYDQNADVVIWTPASSKGVPLCVNPLNFGFETDDSEVVVNSLSMMAHSICSLLGYDPDKDDGLSAESFLYLVFEHVYKSGQRVENFTELCDQIGALPETIRQRSASIISEREIRTLTRKLLNLTIGAKGFMFERGVPLDIDTLLGRNEDDGRARVSVIYLNTLSSQDEKDFFLSQIAQRLYHWMLQNPPKRRGPAVQALFYIDEIAKFIPPVRKPACKDALSTLFRQARKYGVSCLIATQSPGDVDYSALDQFATWNLGQLKTKQTRQKVLGVIQALSSDNAEDVATRLPGLHDGRFLMLCADEYEKPVEYKVRWLVTQHRTLSEDDVAKAVTDEMRERFASQAPPAMTREEPQALDEELEGLAKHIEEALASAGRPMQAAEIAKQLQTDEGRIRNALEAMGEGGRLRSAELFWIGEQDKPSAEDARQLQAAASRTGDEDRTLDYLREARRCVSTSELADALGLSSQKLTRVLAGLAEQEAVSKEKVGGSNLYWAAEYSLLPAAGLMEPVNAAKMVVPESEARPMAESDLAGIFSKSEEIAETEFRHLPLWQIDVTVEKTEGLIFQTTSEETATLYLHGTDGRVCTYDSRTGFAFSEVAGADPVQIADLDDVCTFEERMPGDVALDKRQLDRLMSRKEALDLVERKYLAKARRARVALLPYWRFRIRATEGGKSRDLLLDAVVGKPLDV